MPSWSVMKVLLKELTTGRQVPRVNEPTLVMDDPQQVREYTQAGLEGGVMAPVYLFHCASLPGNSPRRSDSRPGLRSGKSTCPDCAAQFRLPVRRD